MNINDQVIKRGVRDDARYVGRLFRDISSREDGALGGVLSFCVIPYLSLFLHEARAKPSFSVVVDKCVQETAAALNAWSSM